MLLPPLKSLSAFLGSSVLLALLATVACGSENTADKRVEQCLQEMTTEGVFLTSVQGGYYETPAPFLVLGSLDVPIYREAADFHYPDIATVEGELRRFLEKTSASCLSRPSAGEQEGIEVTIPRITEVKLGEGQITVSADYTWRSREGVEPVMASLTTKVASDYRRYHAAMLDVIEAQKEDPNVIVFSELVAVAEKHDIKISYSESPEDFRTIIYALEDEAYVHGRGLEYRFFFAIKYRW